MTDSTEKFFAQFEEHIDSPYEPDMLRKKRLKAWDHLLEMGFPQRTDEPFRYVHFDSIYSGIFEKAENCELTRGSLAHLILPESQGAYLVFANGAFRPELSDFSALTDAVLAPITHACRTFASLLQGTWAKALKEEVDPFASLNNACHHEGVFFYLPPNKKLDRHVQLLHISDIERPSWSMPRIHIVLGKCAEASFIETNSAPNPHAKLFDNRVIDIVLEEGSICSYSQYAPAQEAICFSALRALVKQDARLQTTFVTHSNFARHSIRVQLAGTGSHADMSGVNMLSGNQEGHSHVVIDHQEPNCTSLQLFKNILIDSARSSFEGKIWVRQKAQKTAAYQLNNNLLLSDGAEALSKPNLEIFADDVKASHGATSGQLDEEQLFYLTTRGLSEETAKACLIQGFCQEIVNRIPNSTVREQAHNLILQLYGNHF